VPFEPPQPDVEIVPVRLIAGIERRRVHMMLERDWTSFPGPAVPPFEQTFARATDLGPSRSFGLTREERGAYSVSADGSVLATVAES
jgi:hypothetical protein